MQTVGKKRIFLASPHMSDTHMERYYIEDAFQKNFIAPLGENVACFEKELSQKVGAEQAAALSSGTAAIHMALKALGIKRGDIIFCPTLTFSATANPILYEGAVPVFIDSDEKTWNMSPEALEAAFLKYRALGRLPKAVMVVHLYGKTADLDRIIPICEKYGVPVIEDAAESLGTTYTGEITGGVPKYTGTFGNYGIYSFNGNKIITTSGGGMMVCNLKDKEKAEERVAKVRFWSSQSREACRYYQHKEVGYNYRMSNIVAGIGRGQLTVLDERVKQKQEIYAYYKEKLHTEQKDSPLTMMPLLEKESSNCWLSCALLEKDCGVKPIDLILALEKENIESRHIWKPLHLQPVFADYDFICIDQNGSLIEKEALQVTDKETGADNSVAGTIFARGICLPSDTKNTVEDMERICSIIQIVLTKCNHTAF
jgi:dTDP-4-amino-4,6-dideoxygalactose transaminase